uniref:PAP-associated domain-containing protein n=1 Tax=Caenorhabditis japonica TaxID=281687 RepID=A0A8R1I1L6_CAEJA
MQRCNEHENVREFNQISYKVHSNVTPFIEFNENYREVVNQYEEQFQKLSLDMENFFYRRKQPEEEFQRKMDFCSQLKRTIQKYCPSWIFDIVPTGSSVSGLATSNSDLDVAIHIPQAIKVMHCFTDRIVFFRKIQLEILQIVRRIVVNDEEFKKRINFDKGVQLVQAQIQILKIETVDGIECDISVVLETFLSSMHNSLLIRHFHHIDSRFGPLCAIVKQWAASTEVKKPKEGGFNSYALVLLVIHFLQCGTLPPILPHIQEIYEGKNVIAQDEHRFPKKLDFGAPLPGKIPEIEINPAPVALLFFQFVHYYLHFDFQKYYISMRKAMVINRNRSHSSDVRIQDKKEVYIQDPFDSHNPGRTVNSLKNIKITLRDTVSKFLPNGNNFKFPTLDDILYMDSSKAKFDNEEDRDDAPEEEEKQNL